jgi:hypothetical protein
LRRLIFKLLSAVSYMFVAGSAVASPLTDHFFGQNPQCVFTSIPTLIVADVTISGEIDDSISLYMYRELEKLGCVKIIGVISIFGNGGSSTDAVHLNLLARLKSLDMQDWPVFHGPNNRMRFDNDSKIDQLDQIYLERIAQGINQYDHVIIAELGPLTTSAQLLKTGLIKPSKILKILGVGGRSEGEHFSANKYIPFAFRDMNIAEDRRSVGHLVANYSKMLWMVTYKTGIGVRMIEPEMVSALGSSDLTAHAHERAIKLKMIGYGGKIPSWDTWTTSWFIKAGASRLGCQKENVSMRHGTGFRPSDSMQLQILAPAIQPVIQADICHQTLN